MPAPLSRPVGRRTVLRAIGTGMLLGPLSTVACSAGGRHDNGAADISGGFDWRRAAGEKIKVLQTPHPYQRSFEPMLKDFHDLTGVEVLTDLVPEGDYFDQLGGELRSGSGEHDAFMIGAYFLWQYGPQGWLEDLRPWLENTSATSAEFDFPDIYEGLRTATAWDFQVGSPLGTGGQWAIPWGFETNVIAYNKTLFDARGLRPAETLDELVQLATDLTDRRENRYGISFRGSRSWATVPPRFMPQLTRAGGPDDETPRRRLTARMNSPEAVDFTRKWVELARAGGPIAWPTYEYPDCARDLGFGSAAMVFDADAVTYPQNKPGAGAQAGNLAWHPGPAGPDGSYATNLWTWSYAMNAASRNKLAAWLFIQWATGRDALTQGVQQTRLQFTPHTSVFDTTEDWAVAIRDIYDGQDAQRRLDELAQASTTKANAGAS